MKNTRVRGLLVGATSLIAVGALSAAWATSSQAASSRFVTATATTGDVSQSFLATGTISRDSVVDVTFSVDGTVKRVRVAVGDQVAAGDVLATLDSTALKLALLNAQTDLAGAKADLYAAENPSSTSSGGGSGGSLPSGGAGTGGGSSTPGGTDPDGGATSGISATDAALLYEAIAAVNVATVKWSNPDQPTTCDAIQTALLNANEQTDTGSGDTGSGSGDGSGDTGSGSDGSGSGDAGDADSGSGDNGSDDAGDTGSGDSGSDATGDAGSGDTGDGGSDEAADSDGSDSGDSAEDGSEADQLALVVDDITLEDIKACGEAREELVLANAVLADYYQQLITTGTIDTGDDTTPDDDTEDTDDTDTAGTPAPDRSSGSSSSGSAARSSSGSSSAGVSARAVASAEAGVLRAQQAVDSAEAALENAELVAPLSGTVGSVGLSAGGGSSAGAITIVGEGTAVISFEAPLTTRAALSQGMAATISPAGSDTRLTGTITSIAVLETSGTAGDNPTYTTRVVVTDPDMLLKEGAKAGVEIVTATAGGVVLVPASAVTPTGSGSGTVGVIDPASSDTAETVDVSTGAVGGGRVEITGGLTEGQIVVLSDRTLDIDTLTSSQSNRGLGGGFPR